MRMTGYPVGRRVMGSSGNPVMTRSTVMRSGYGVDVLRGGGDDEMAYADWSDFEKLVV